MQSNNELIRSKLKLVLLVLAMLTFNCSTAQGFISLTKKDKDSIKEIDFIDKEYTFLDRNFNIQKNKLLKRSDENTLQKFRQCENYNDSLRVVLEFDLKNNYAEHLAFHRILKTWQNVSFYIWLTPKKTKQLANKLNIFHPHKFYEFLIAETENETREALLNRLYLKLKKELEKEINYSTNKELIYQAFRYNPDRLKMKRQYLENHSGHKH